MATAKKPPKAGKDTIYVDPDDEITAVIDKVEGAEQNIVALVLPKRFTTLQSIVNMRLLKRAADNSKKNVVLITSEGALLPLAGASGLHVAKNLQSKPEIPPPPTVDSPPAKTDDDAEPDPDEQGDKAKLDHHRAAGALAAAAVLDMEEEGDEKAETTTAKTKNKKLKVPDFDKFRLLIFAGVGAVIALIIFIFMATSVLPKSTITVKTASEQVSADFNFTTSEKAEALDEAKKVVPAELKKEDQTESVSIRATGERNDGKKASGSVTMATQRCAPNIPVNPPAGVPAGTGVSSGGKVYVSQSTANFSYDGGSGSCVNYKSNSVSIQAQDAGSAGNVSGASFSVVGRSDVSASGSASGGTDDITKIISAQDVDNAKKAITTEESDKFGQEFRENLEKEGYYVVEQTLKLSEPSVTSNPAVGAEAESASGTVKITYSAIVVKKDDLQKVIEAALNEQIDKDKQELSEGDITEAAEITVVSQGKTADATLNVAVEYSAVPKLNQEEIKTLVGGKKKSEIQQIITGYPGVEEVHVHMSPFWVSKAPSKPGKITIVLEKVPQPQQGEQPQDGN